MAQTVFDASQEEQNARRQQLEAELAQLQQQAQPVGLPSREEAAGAATPARTLIGRSNPDASSGSPKPAAESETPAERNPYAPSADPLHQAQQEAVGAAAPSESNGQPPTAEQPPAPAPGSGQEPVPVVIQNVAPDSTSLKRQPEDYSEVIRQNRPTNNPFAAFSVRPPGARFVNQHSEEKILMALRQHPIVNLRWILIALLLILAPFLLFPIFPLFDFLPARFQFFTMIGWYLFTSAFIIENFLFWYYNIYIITDERIVDIDFYSLIFRSISAAKLDNIEDTTAQTKGVLGAIFNFGDVTIQTAAEQREFEFANVPQPAVVTKFINELILEEEREKLEGRVM